MSLIRRVSLLMLLVVVLALISGVVTTLIAARDTPQAQLVVKNRDNAQSLALALSQQKGDTALMELVLAAQFDTGHYRRIEWTGTDGRSVFRREAQASATRAPDWFARALPVDAEPGIAQLSDGWRAIGQLQLVSQSAYALDALWRAGLRAAELLALVGLIGGALAAWGLRAIRRPLDAAVEQAEALQKGQFVTVAEPKVAELRPLARSMNTMVGRLSTMFDAQAKQVEALRQQAQTDALTGLFNRRQFMLEASPRFESSSGDAQALLLWRVQDLDGLNRRIGHAAVDQMLRTLAQTLGSSDEDDQPLLGRLNGSDFVLAVSRLDAQALARSLMARVRGALSACDGAPAVVVGVAEAAQSVGLPAAMSVADRALAQAEAEGPHAVVARTCAGSAPTQGEGDWQRQLLQALDEQRSSLAEYPVRDASGVLMHLDCPLRVQLRRDGAFESAASWLALATRSRLTTTLDQRAVTLALQQIQRDGVARCVNLAPASLRATEFVAAVSVQLQAAAVAAAKLWIDIPEVLAVSHPGVIQEVTRRWRPLGVHVGLEHAGAALSGMTRLYELGLD
jgi:diguanylate cyclase (GGDEF)-like protein